MVKKYPGHLPADNIMAEIEMTLKRHAGDQQGLIETLRYLPDVLESTATGALGEQREELTEIKRRFDAAYQKIMASNKTASSTIEAATGHLREQGEVAIKDAFADKVSDWAQIMKLEPLRVEHEPEIIRAILHLIDPHIFQQEFNAMDESRQRELLPELFLTQED
jgi:hypothetical protein